MKHEIYFDSGTGRGIGVEVRVTNQRGESVIQHSGLKNITINEYGNFHLGFDKTNNYGELAGLFIALKLAIKYNVKVIKGDSQVVIDYWSQGKHHMSDVSTVKLINRVIMLRKAFINNGGRIIKIKGKDNIADIGFHKEKY